jgi:hypothetical protein
MPTVPPSAAWWSATAGAGHADRPLFNAEHAAGLIGDLRAGSSTRLLCGGLSRGAYFTPAVVEGVAPGDAISRQGFFGPALWVHPVAPGQVHAWLRANEFPLSDTVLSTRPEVIEAFALQSRAARVCVNEDPSVNPCSSPGRLSAQRAQSGVHLDRQVPPDVPDRRPRRCRRSFHPAPSEPPEMALPRLDLSIRTKIIVADSAARADGAGLFIRDRSTSHRAAGDRRWTF